MKTTSKPLLLALIPSLSLALAACHGQGAPSSFGTPPDQLEAPSVTGLATSQEVTQSGAVVVTGSARDFAINVGSNASLTVHTPGLSDLSTLGGRTLTFDFPATVPFAPSTRSLLVTDAQGPVYVVDLGPETGIDTDTLFGTGFATYGTPVASVVDDVTGGSVSGYIETDYTPIVFKSDSGPVSLLPGQVGAVTVKGAVYRVAVIGATDVTYAGNTELGCGPSSTMVYEMLRVEAAPAPLSVTRPASLGAISLGCGI
jgi:hypothetical protein